MTPPELQARRDEARDPSTIEERLVTLAGDGSSRVRLAVAKNPSTPLATLEHLTDDHWWAVAESAARRAGLSMPALKNRGWSVAMVARHLGEPDYEVTNPYYRSAPPQRLWRRSRVEAAEKGADWLADRDKAARRSRVGKDAASARAARLLAEVDALIAPRLASLLALDEENLFERAVEHRNLVALNHTDFIPATRAIASPESLERWAVNYVLHVVTDDESVSLLRVQVGRSKVLDLVRDQVYEAITDAYPGLAAECDRQREMREVRDL